jgi:penicillin-binding protein 1A
MADSPKQTGATTPRTRVEVANRADGGFFYWIAKLSGFAVLIVAALGASAAVLTYRYFSIHAPPVPDLRTYAKVTPSVSRMYAADGTLLGEFAKEWREIVPFDEIPPRLVNAFLAVEDHDFFNHGGLYFKGIARAVWANLTAGDFAQGGSTITQQVAKQFLGGEKSLSRKGKEAVMARRLESRYSKKAILSVYLNHIYLGDGAWGVAAAARRYFQKDLDQLTLAESAMIAGLAKAPTAYSPIHKQSLAIERRNVVLDKMATYKLATAAEVAAAKAEPIKLNLYRDVFPDRDPYYAEHVRRYVTEAYKNDGLFSQGLRIETAAEPTWEAAAYENADFGARHQDKRQGWRGPEWRVDGAARDMVLERQRQLYGAGPLIAGKRYLAVVDKVDGEHAEVVVGDRKLQLPLHNMRWAARWEPGNAENDHEIDSANRVVKRGDVIWVERETRTLGRFRDWALPDHTNPTWLPHDDQREWDAAHADVVRLEQVPHPQIALFTADHHTGYVVAMVGGHDYDRSVYNRTVQACRQPGSTYKPIYYALGLDQGFGFDTVLDDVPVQITDPDTGETWSPTNLGETLDGDVTLEYALVFSKNIPSVDLFRRLGAKNVEAWARRLGFTTKIFADDALALGASCTHLDEMVRAFSVFARGGTWFPRPPGKDKSWVYVRRILDRAGSTIEDNTTPEDPQLTTGDRLDRLANLAGIKPEQAIAPRTAFLISKLLAEEVTFGFANVLRATEVNAAGKTGTSSATHDNIFIAFTSKFSTAVWMGDDKKERALGKKDAAYMTVVPLWSRYMFEAAHAYPNPAIPWLIPPGVSPNDRGDHSKGVHGPQMDLIFRPAKKKSDDGGDAAPADQPPA